MPWLIGGGVLLALLLSSNSSTAAATPAYAPAVPPQPQSPYLPSSPAYLPVSSPPPSLQAHLATVLSQPSSTPSVVTDLFNPPPSVTQSVFTSPPYGSAPGHNQFAWWINHYTGSDYKNGQTISQHDIDDAVHNAIHTGTLHDVAMLQEFATQLNGQQVPGYSTIPNVLTNFILSLQTDAIAPYVSLYANVHNWPTADTKADNTAIPAAEKADQAALLRTIANVKTLGTVSDCKNLGTLLMGYTDFGIQWDSYGASLVAYANTPAFRAAAAARAKPKPAPAPVRATAVSVARVRAPSSSPIGVTPPPAAPPPPADTGEASSGSGFNWQDQGNTTPPNPGDGVAAVVVGPDGTSYSVTGIVDADDGTNVTFTVNTDTSGALTPGQQMVVPLSYVAVVAGDNQTYDEGEPPMPSTPSADAGESDVGSGESGPELGG